MFTGEYEHTLDDKVGVASGLAYTAAGGEVLEVREAILEKLARKDNPQSVLGVFVQRYADLGRFNASAASVFVALEGVKDPGNLGAILRTVALLTGSGAKLKLVEETIDGVKLTDPSQYAKLFMNKKPGDKVKVSYWRAGRTGEATLALEDLPGY